MEFVLFYRSLIVLIGFLCLDPVFGAVCGFNPCMNGGTCTPQGNDFFCACPSGFTGIVCESMMTTMTTTSTTTTTTTKFPATLPHTCDFNPCRNGGYCVATGPDYACFCPSSFSGLLCQTANSSSVATSVSAAPCPFNPCRNSGFCVSAGNNYECFCPTTYTGDYCETEVATQTTTKTSLATTSLTPSTTLSNVCKVDIQFLLDGSGSLRQANFDKQLDFVKNLVHSLFTEGHDVRVGATIFDSSVHNQFWLNTHLTEHEIIAAISNIGYTGGTTNTGMGLEYTRTLAFTASHGDRSDAANIVIIITDGQSTDPPKTALQADLLHQANIGVIAVGVGGQIDNRELELIAGDKRHVYTVSNYSALKNIKDDVLYSACGRNAG